MATTGLKQKSSLDTLLGSMDELVESAAQKMSAEEMRQAGKEISEGIDRVVSGHRKQRRETA